MFLFVTFTCFYTLGIPWAPGSEFKIDNKGVVMLIHPHSLDKINRSDTLKTRKVTISIRVITLW